MRRTYGERRARQGTAKLSLNAAERSGRLVFEARAVSYAWGGHPIVKDFHATILRGDRIGIIGPNGCGKSTLLNLLLGGLVPNAGTVERGTRLDIAYFDQLREQLDLDKTVIENVAGGSDKVVVNGKSKHVISYLQDFLFPPQRCRQPARALSGGERNRLLLAKLFTRPANLLVMDEPTNDLDIETLELLEELLLDFDGTLLLVSHDRAFIDNVVTSTLVFEGGGRVESYVGGYADWLRQRQRVEPPERTPAPADRKVRQVVKDAEQGTPKKKPKKLGYKAQRELEQLPALIESLEHELAQVQVALGDPALYRDAPERAATLQQRMADMEDQLARHYARWESLEG
jgi:ATP-binding cassette subfamily F protein uup